MTKRARDARDRFPIGSVWTYQHPDDGGGHVCFLITRRQAADCWEFLVLFDDGTSPLGALSNERFWLGSSVAAHAERLL